MVNDALAIIISYADCLRHEMGSGYPAYPARLQAIDGELITRE
jgi:hypothetical protein